MHKGSYKNFFLAKTTHRLAKVSTLAVASCVLFTMINIDASASSVNPQVRAIHTEAGIIVNSEQVGGNRHFTGLAKYWSKVTSSSPITLSAPPTTGTTTVSGGSNSTTTTAPASGGSGGGGGGGGGSGGGSTTTTTTPPTATTTTTTTAPANSSRIATTSGLITAGASRSECAELNFSDTGLASIQSAVASWDATTSSTATCLLAYLNGAPSWSQWEDPWVTAAQYGYTQWVAQSPQSRQLVLQVDLIPDSLENTNNPLSWEQSCAAGDFTSYATTLGNNLVAAGLGNSVIRLGPEMNGTWEADYMGSTAQEQSLWASCFDNEVTGLRQAAGANFLIDWNPNACSIPYSTIYPGNAFVDIIGLDAYDASCVSSSAVSFSTLVNEPDGLASVVAFANSQGKPMSLPEWGLYSAYGGDNPAYINGIASMIAQGNFSFEAYFDAGAQNTLELGSGTPLSTAAFQQWFGNS
jgi:hypothetical protein